MTPRGSVSPNYKAMAEFRHQIRRFLRFSEETARAGGLEPQQYQLLLTLKGMDGDVVPKIGEIAQRLQIQHHSTVELVDRLVRRGLIRRRRSDSDRRQVILELTPRGDKVLQDLALRHWSEYRSMAPELIGSLKKVMRENQHTDGAGRTRSKTAARAPR